LALERALVLVQEQAVAPQVLALEQVADAKEAAAVQVELCRKIRRAFCRFG
jgi:hypothetical protein